MGSWATSFARRYREVRARTVALTRSLTLEDQLIQSFAYASPTKWHLGHSTWFFEQFVAGPFAHARWNQDWSHLLNSYYEGLGSLHPRALRGALSRPSYEEILAYRARIDEIILEHLSKREGEDPCPELSAMMDLGLAHEEQHQELLLTDLLANHSLHPDAPCLFAPQSAPAHAKASAQWWTFEEAIAKIGLASGFGFDNELPRHRYIVHPFALSKDLVTNGQMLAFIRDKGYQRPTLWLSDGIEWVREHQVTHPRYWRKRESSFTQWTLYGEQSLNEDAPLVHINGYEADALARWLGGRLPTEQEWEHAVHHLADSPSKARWLGSGPVMPIAGQSSLFGELWVWTRSSYLPYPGYQVQRGAVGEYNGKFMSGQWVLRGGSCASAPHHLRPSYRNFFHPQRRWQFAGLRLARDA